QLRDLSDHGSTFTLKDFEQFPGGCGCPDAGFFDSLQFSFSGTGRATTRRWLISTTTATIWVGDSRAICAQVQERGFSLAGTEAPQLGQLSLSCIGGDYGLCQYIGCLLRFFGDVTCTCSSSLDTFVQVVDLPKGSGHMLLNSRNLLVQRDIGVQVGVDTGLLRVPLFFPCGYLC